MIGVGVDIIELRRVEAMTNLNRAAEYVLTPEEIKEFYQCPDRIQFFTSRFAAKEAVIKAFPTRLAPHDFSIAKEGEKPVVTFFNPQHGRYPVFLSISHSLDYVASFAVVLEPQ